MVTPREVLPRAAMLLAVFAALSTEVPVTAVAQERQARVDRPAWLDEAVPALARELTGQYGAAQQARVERGLKQVASFWRAEDGDRASFDEFVRANFAGDQATLDQIFSRYLYISEQLAGHMNEISLALRRQADLDLGPILPFDEAFAGYQPAAHLTDDFFANKIAFVVLLNFPLTTLEERLRDGAAWTRRQWAEARLASWFDTRVPAEVQLEVARVGSMASQYIAEYNVWMHHLVDAKGERLFPAKLRLLSHWNLRDQLKADYAEGKKGLARQRMIQQVMERIVTQTIPAGVVNSPYVDWNPYTNEVRAAAVQDADAPPPPDLRVSNAPEPDTRYATLLATFRAARLVDPYSPTAPTHILRSFNEGREIPEERVAAMFEAVLSSPLLGEVAQVIRKRLGRPLEPFDIWYNGFRPRGTYTEAELDRVVRERYPTAEAYERDMPNLLAGLGFTRERAQQLSSMIVVDPARGSGHAWGASMRGAKAHLRTRVGPNGMDYKGFNIAVHEMGHSVEQTISLNDVDYITLQGVPNTAFTEALAFVFQARDLELLGLAKPDEQARTVGILDEFWGMAEIAAVALVDMRIWHWMYDHPDATPAQLKDATIQIAREIWNRYYAPVIGKRDVLLLAIYSHIIDSQLYLPDYPVGHLIARQIEEQMERAGSLGAEVDRVCRTGSVTPDLWMVQATGKPVGPEALLAATRRALDALKAGGR